MKDVISLGSVSRISIRPGTFANPPFSRSNAESLITRATWVISNCAAPSLATSSKTFGADYNPENEILVTVGVSEALDLALRALLQSRRRSTLHTTVLRLVSRHDPVLLTAHPSRWKRVRKTGSGLTREMLEAKVTARTKVLMLNFPNNPTGAVMLPADLEAIAAFARERDLIVINRRKFTAN